MSGAEVGTLESAALKRKERLAALRDAKNKGEKGASSAAPLPKPQFRSYKPGDSSFADSVLPEGKTGQVIDHVREELSKAGEGVVIDELDFMSLAPRKPDWDLKRDVAPDLEKLERRTQKAIAEIIRERLKAENAPLADVVAEVESLAQQENLDDDDE